MASFNGIVYLTTNLVNHKIYVGLSTKNQLSYVGSGVLLSKAVKKYGRNSFKKEILRSNISTPEELRSWENYYVNLYNSQNKDIGYNMCPGGLGGGWTHDSTAIEKIRERSNQEDNKIRIKEIQKLAWESRRGTHHSKESKLKINNTKFGKDRKIQILFKDNTLFKEVDFISEASLLTNVSASSIKNNLCGLSKSTRKHIFKYKEI